MTKVNMVNFAGKLCLAPMVRSGEITNRLLALKYGADLVWTPEYVDRKIIQTKRIVNEQTNTIDYVVEEYIKKKDLHRNKVVFRSSPEERGRLIFQLGSSDPKLAVEAASKVIDDVDGIDLNCGCPKPFSTHSGMGAALLLTPDLLCTILSELIEKVGRPNNKSISCKIRLLDDYQSSHDLIEQICKTGITNLTIHCRTRDMRSREDPIWKYLTKLIPFVQSKGVSLIINGNLQSRIDFQNLQNVFNNEELGGMIAECAEANPSVFSEIPLTPFEILPVFHQLSNKYNYDAFQNTKYMLLNQIPGKSPFYQRFAQTKCIEDLDALMKDEFNNDEKNLFSGIFLKDLTKHKILKGREEYLKWMDERKQLMGKLYEESIGFGDNEIKEELLALKERQQKVVQNVQKKEKSKKNVKKTEITAHLIDNEKRVSTEQTTAESTKKQKLLV